MPHCRVLSHVPKALSRVRCVCTFSSLTNSPPDFTVDQSFQVSVNFFFCHCCSKITATSSHEHNLLCFSSTVFGFLLLILHHFGLDARLFIISNSAYSRSLRSHSLTEWGCDSICVGCKTGMIVELGICVFSDAIRVDYTSPPALI